MKCGDCAIYGTDACQYTFAVCEEDEACEVFIGEENNEEITVFSIGN